MGMMNSRGGTRNKRALMSEINVTPLVDVMLVLLIVFMVTAPMMVTGIHVDLPETQASPVTSQEEPLAISINKKGEVYILDTMIPRKNLADKLKAITKAKMDTRIFVRGDKNVSYGEIVDIVSEINAAGFAKVALITQIKH
ncbi:MAG: protein TolR [Pseudomonadota bacterium]